MKNSRIKDIVDVACAGTSTNEDCSNGNLTNSGGGNDPTDAEYGYAHWLTSDGA
jgi:hypothetical protein